MMHNCFTSRDDYVTKSAPRLWMFMRQRPARNFCCFLHLPEFEGRHPLTCSHFETAGKECRMPQGRHGIKPKPLAPDLERRGQPPPPRNLNSEQPRRVHPRRLRSEAWRAGRGHPKDPECDVHQFRNTAGSSVGGAVTVLECQGPLWGGSGRKFWD